MENDNKELIHKFYSSFQNLDADGMRKCYHPEVQFEDPAFGKLKGKDASDMWAMLCKSQKDKGFILSFKDIKEENQKVSCVWEAKYTFSQTGRKVHNIIHAEFEFLEGKIIKHHDSFDLYKWAKQALGLKGILIGWTPFFKTKLNHSTKALLTKYQNSIS